MTISIFDLFSIGIGPSSSHTVGPMRAAFEFLHAIPVKRLAHATRIQIELFGSLALTGQGHGTDKAILNGLSGMQPETVDPDEVDNTVKRIHDAHSITLLNQHPVEFYPERDFIFHRHTCLPKHSNGMRFSLLDVAQQTIHTDVYYSIGGGFIVTDNVFGEIPQTTQNIPYPFKTAQQLFQQCTSHQISIAQLMLANETALHPDGDIRQRLLHIATTMANCIERGCQTRGILPGALKIPRRAPDLYEKLQQRGILSRHENQDIMNWLNVFAIAVNEENAAGSRIVTAPTNGAAGIIPAVLEYLKRFHLHTHENAHALETDIIDFLLTAGAIAILYKLGASISGAEVGCQGEVGVAASMAAAGLAAALGGELAHIENAAEIAMEHHLGMTCDPIGGLVQIPCIERNAMGAIKAVNAARLALLGNGRYHVSLDKVIATMRQTGHDMMTQYKETSQGGLAVNLTEC